MSGQETDESESVVDPGAWYLQNLDPSWPQMYPKLIGILYAKEILL